MRRFEGQQDYRASLAAVRQMLERAGSARAVDEAELRARRVDVLTVVARQRAVVAGLGSLAGCAPGLSPDMEALLSRLDQHLAAEIVSEPTSVVETRVGVDETIAAA
jgi:hypothetical protein